MTEVIPIFLASDDFYAPIMCVTIVSILRYTSKKINFYILDGGISSGNKNLIYKSIKKYQYFQNIEYINMDISLVENFPNQQHFSLNTYFRYFIANMKPNLKKVLYIDSDMLCMGDISEIYGITLKNEGIAAVPYICNNPKYKQTSHFKWVTEQKEKLHLNQEFLYFNAGLLLMDLEYIRSHQLVNKMIDLTLKLRKIISCPDQDIFNILFQKYKVLPDYYNIVVDMTDDLLDINKFVKENTNHCSIIHYTGGANKRPWLGCKILAKHFWKIAKTTKFFEKLKEMSEKKQGIKHITCKLLNITVLETLSCEQQSKRLFKIFKIPVLKIKNKISVGCEKIRYCVFNIPLIKIKKKKNNMKYYFLGIPVLKVIKK